MKISRNDWLAMGGLALILALAAYLRLANNGTIPGWYTDEGTHLEIVRHLAQGGCSTWRSGSPLFFLPSCPCLTCCWPFIPRRSCIAVLALGMRIN